MENATAFAQPGVAGLSDRACAAWNRLRDGAGVISNADWGPECCDDVFSELCGKWLQRVLDWQLKGQLVRRVDMECERALLSDEEVELLREDLCAFFE